MNLLIRLKDTLKDIYADYDLIVRPVLKFGLAVLIFLIINNELGYLSALNNLFVLIVLAVICAILPMNGIVVIGVLLIIAHCFGLGVEVGGFAAILYLLMTLLYFRFVPKDALAVLLTPVAFICRVPVAVPLCLGQIRGILSSISVAFGILSWAFIQSVPAVIEPLKNVPDVSLLDVLQAMPNALLTQETFLQIIIFVAVLLIVAGVRRLGSDYAHEVGIVLGAVAYMFLTVFAARMTDMELDFQEVLINTVGSILIAFFLKIFYFSADYSASERLLFEDDRYYYRVKAIPKRNPVDSRTGELLEAESDAEMPFIDVKRFRQTREEEIDRKFKGINLQSKLEQSLRNYRADMDEEEIPERKETAAPDEKPETVLEEVRETLPEEAQETVPAEAQDTVQIEVPEILPEEKQETIPDTEVLETMPFVEMTEASEERAEGSEEQMF